MRGGDPVASPEDDGVASANAVVRFLLELAALGVFGYWGYSFGGTPVGKLGIGIGLPLVVVLVWGVFGAPAAPYRLEQPWRVLLEILVLGGAVLALSLLGRPVLAAGFAVVAALNTTLLYVLGRP